jgi:2-desacetyl-2-hydroxyethyl bacteriochlorophyllide A dehydrogenase
VRKLGEIYKNMKNSVYSFREKRFHLVDSLLPKIKSDEVLVRIKASALCGTDLHIMKGELMDKVYGKKNITLGHEWTGFVEKIGKKVNKKWLGKRVFGSPHIPCGKCKYCKIGKESLCDHQAIFGMTRPGAHAEYLLAPESTLFTLPDKIDFATGALLSDTVSTAYHAIKKIELKSRNKYLILGSGPVGLTIGVLLKILGQKNINILEKSPYRTGIAKKLLGANVFNEKNSLVLRRTIDVVFDTTGSEKALEIGFHSLVRGGQLIIIGIHNKPFMLDSLRLMYREIAIMGSFGYSHQEAAEFTKLFCQGKNSRELARVISHKFSISKVDQAYKMFSSHNCGKVVLIN